MPLPPRGSIQSYVTTFLLGMIVGASLIASPAIGLMLVVAAAWWLVWSIIR